MSLPTPMKIKISAKNKPKLRPVQLAKVSTLYCITSCWLSTMATLVKLVCQQQ